MTDKIIYIDSSVGTGGVGSLIDPYNLLSDIDAGDWTALNAACVANDAAEINLQGTFLETLTVGEDGEASYPIVIQSYGTGATIDGEDTRSSCISFNSKDYITVSNLTLQNATGMCIGVSATEYATITECTIKDSVKGIGGLATNGNITNLTITHNSISDCGDSGAEAGIWLTYGAAAYIVHTVTIEHNDIYNNYHGLRFVSTDKLNNKLSALTIRYNDIHGNDINGSAISSIDNSIGSNVFGFNSVYDNGSGAVGTNANGAWFGFCSYFTISDNIVWGNLTGIYDGIGIFLDRATDAGTGSHHNLVTRNISFGHDSQHGNDPWGEDGQANSSGLGVCCEAHDNIFSYNVSFDNAVGIHIGGSGADNVFYHNTSFLNRIGILVDTAATGTGTILKNNIIANNTKTSVDETTVYDLCISDNNVESITEDYNCFGASPTFLNYLIGSIGANSIALDPLLTSTGKVLIDSPVIEAGTLLSGINNNDELDPWGNITILPANIGAYQGNGYQYGQLKFGRSKWGNGAFSKDKW